MLRIGLIGTGGFAQARLCPALRTAKGIRFRSVLSRDGGRATEVARAEGAEVGTGSEAEFFSDPDLDAVFVASPDPTHEAFVLAAARAGKHVLCEKPLATSLAAAARMRDACKAAGVVLSIGYNNRHHPAHLKILELIRSGELGKVERIRARYMGQARDATNWRCGPPNPWWALAAVGTHLVDLCTAVASEDEVEDVFARFSSPVFGAPNEEIAVVSLKFRGGATADLEASMSLPPFPSRLEVTGRKGFAAADGTMGYGSQGSLLVNGVPVAIGPADGYRAELEDFAQAIATGRPPAATGETGVKNVAVLEAASRSHATGRRVAPERA